MQDTKKIANQNQSDSDSSNFNRRPNQELKEKWKKEQLKLKEQLIKEDKIDFAIDSIWPKPDELLIKVNKKQTGTSSALSIVPTDQIKPDKTKQPLERIGGVDISFVKGSETDAVACLVILSFPDLKVIYKLMKIVQLTLPYISGFLAFREVSLYTISQNNFGAFEYYTRFTLIISKKILFVTVYLHRSTTCLNLFKN